MVTAAPVGEGLLVADVSDEPSPEVVVASLVLSLELAVLEEERVARLRVVLRDALVPVMPADPGAVPEGAEVAVTVTLEDAVGDPEAEAEKDRDAEEDALDDEEPPVMLKRPV